MVQTRKQEESSGSGVKMPGRDLRTSTKDLKGRSDDADKDEDNEWPSQNFPQNSSRPQRTRKPNTRYEDISDPPRSRQHKVVYFDPGSSASEDDTQSDDSLYGVAQRGRNQRIDRYRHNRRRKTQQRIVNISGVSNGHSEVSMEEDNPNLEDYGVRRSTRQRKTTNPSWILGTPEVRGYPTYRGQAGLLPSQGMCQTRSRDRARSREAATDGEQAATPSSPVLKQAPPVRDRRKVVKDENNSGEDNEAEGGDEQEAEEPEDKAPCSAEEDKPDAEETQQKRRTRQMINPPANDNFTDMYSRVKRIRRPTMRFSYSPSKSRSKTYSARDGIDCSSSDDEMEEGESDREQGNEKRGRERASVRTRKYELRVIKPTVDRFQVQEVPVRRSSRALAKEYCNTILRRLGRCPPKRYGSASSSSSDSESRFEHKKAKSLAKARSRCMPLNYHAKDSQVTGHHTIRSKDGKTANLADVGPMALDTTIRFSHVGGLEDHIRCLQEMVVFPMLYKEIFEQFNITAPKGVLFHGPPGTGKTLIARALANECSQGEHKVKFFMRKGADCLSKWVGESERQLRLLFEQAHQMRPSIIFFDEIDGLAPVRSSKQDQIHASIVSTLLALMDGLDNRGEVIVIGATNRIDAIDPALRRPGRFDRELYFPLPASKERQEILRIHMNKWDEAPAEELLDELAEKAGGYCGSDLRALCAESVVQALRRTYPQIYKSSRKLLLDSRQVKVLKEDFAKAQASIVPAAHRVCPNVAHKLKPFLQPLLESSVNAVLTQLQEIFPHGLKKDVDPWLTVNRPRLMLTGCGSEFAQTSHIAPAVLYHMEHVRVHTLDLTTLYEVSARSPEEAVIQVFQEARRNPPAVIYTPSVGQWWEMVPATVQSVFLLQLGNVDQNSPVLLLSTTDSSYSELPEQLCGLFSEYRDEVFTMSCPGDSEREAFFKPLFLNKATAPPPPPKPSEDELEELPLAPPPEPAKLTEHELGKLYQDEEVTLRELRIFLREVCAKLARNRMFFMFTKPVNITEVPDYLEIIQQPMDLETMMTKIDQHHYECAKQFLDDIDLICRNALEYNPDRDPADKLIRHRACSLRDSAYALIKAEMDSDFEVKCKTISQSRKKREESPSRFAPAPDFIHTVNSAPANQPNRTQPSSKAQSVRAPSNLVNGDLSSHSSLASTGATPVAAAPQSSGKKRKKTSVWCRGFIQTKKKKRLIPPTQESPTKSPEANGTDKDGKSGSSESPQGPSSQDKDSIDDVAQMSVDEKSASASSSPLKNGLVNGDVDPEQMETITERSSPGRRSDAKENDGVCDESAKPLRTSGSPSNKPSLKSAFSDSEGTQTSGAETSKRRTKSLDSRKSSTGTLPVLNTVLVDKAGLEKLLLETVEATSTCPAEVIIEVYNRLSKCVERFHTVWDRHTLPQVLKKEIERFEAHWKEKHHHA